MITLIGRRFCLDHTSFWCLRAVRYKVGYHRNGTSHMQVTKMIR